LEALVEVLHRVARSTLTVAAEVPASHRSAPVLGTSRFGTGCVVDEVGHVLTVNYVVLGASALALIDVEGRRYAAELVAQDFATGIAVLRMDAGSDIPAVPPADSDALSQGEGVFLVASSGDEERRAASGAVCSLDPFDAYWEYRLERAIWLTCANPGLGGGPVCNRFGQIVGVTSLNLGNIGRSTLAVPAEHFFGHSDELLAHGRRVSRPRRAWLGMFCYSFPGRTVVAGLIPGAPGEKCGLEVGDVIARVDGTAVHARAELYARIWSRSPGDVVKVDVLRDGAPVGVAVRSVDVEEFFARALRRPAFRRRCRPVSCVRRRSAPRRRRRSNRSA
jgi:S1-C subfamily serine protease